MLVDSHACTQQHTWACAKGAGQANRVVLRGADRGVRGTEPQSCRARRRVGVKGHRVADRGLEWGRVNPSTVCTKQARRRPALLPTGGYLITYACTVAHTNTHERVHRELQTSTRQGDWEHARAGWLRASAGPPAFSKVEFKLKLTWVHGSVCSRTARHSSLSRTMFSTPAGSEARPAAHTQCSPILTRRTAKPACINQHRVTMDAFQFKLAMKRGACVRSTRRLCCTRAVSVVQPIPY